MNSEIILSLCIPTYNRATYLDKCLQSIVKQIGNNESVEVIVSDNVSEDNTREIVMGYAKTYTNIKYFKNDTNIGGDKNIIKVLTLGNGKFLKLLNDYVEFKEGSILKIFEIVKKHLDTREILFFTNGASHLKGEFYYSKNLNEFIGVASFWSTWIGSFGIWKEELPGILKTISFKTPCYLHTEVLFACFDLGKYAITYAREIFNSNKVIGKKTGYNFFDFFITYYLNTLIKGLKDEKKISYLTYLKEKNSFFSNFVFYWYKQIRIKKNHSIEFNTERMESTIFKTYRYSPVFYQYLLYLPFYLIGFQFKKLKRNS